MFSFFNKESNNVASAAILVGILSVVSRVFGFARDRILSGEFGAGATLDAYYAAFKIPDTIFTLIVLGALSGSFIPIFLKRHQSLHKERAFEFTNTVLHLMAFAFLAFSAVCFVFAPQIMQLTAPGFPASTILLAAKMMRIMLIAQMLLAVSMVFGNVLQGLRRFFYPSLAPVLYNVGIIIGAVYLEPLFPTLGLAWGVVLGAFLHAVIQGWAAWHSGWRYRARLKIDDDVREMFRVMGPRVMSLGLLQVQAILLSLLASFLPVGSVTIYQFANNIQYFPIGIIAVSYAIAAFPVFCAHAAANKAQEMADSVSDSLRQVFFFMVPATICFLFLHTQLVRAVVGTGNFSWSDTTQTATALAFFSLGFIPQAAVLILTRAFLAMRDTWTPFIAGFVTAVISFFAAQSLMGAMGVAGLALASVIAATVDMMLLWIILRGRLGTLDESRMIRSLFVMVIAGVISGVAVQLTKMGIGTIFDINSFLTVVIQIIAASVVGILVYGLIAYAFKSEELSTVLSGLKRRLIKTARPTEVAQG